MDSSLRGSWAVITVILAVYVSLSNADLCNPIDKKALLEFKAGFIISWYFDTWEAETDCCLWNGVKCTNSGRVQGLTVYNPYAHHGPASVAERNTSYEGEVGATLGDLTELRSLELSMILFNGPMPNTFHKLKKLKDLTMFYNNFSSYLSPSIGGATSLTSLAVDGDSFLWSFPGLSPAAIPPSFCQLRNIRTLRLTSFSLTGKIPECFCKFHHLTDLELDGNNLEGEIPSCIGESLRKLEALSVSSNRFVGSIPGTLGGLNRLRLLSLSQNQLSGSIPSELGSLGSLQSLDLSRNFLSGPIPAAIGSLAELGFLDLSFNSLTRIPPELEKLVNIGSIRMSHNQLQGRLPPEIGNCGNESFGLYIDISNNRLSGSIPNAFGSGSISYFFAANNLFTGGFPLTLAMVGKVDLSNNRLSDVRAVGTLPPAPALYSLSLQNNLLSGPVPSWLAGLAASVDYYYLIEIDISVNEFTGPVPASLLENLWSFNASHNRLDGQLPTMTTSRSGILDLSHNSVSGPVTSAFIGSLLNTTCLLDLSYNRLSGPLPENSGDFDFLYYLDLCHNKLSGEVPSSIEEIPNLQYLDLSYNNFTGNVPSKNNTTPYLTSS
ncbi:hypothetical protein R1flu_020373 [Riccia fluitans]|uniref:Leucine-rich repeat-containing N-terminal plant-type domain-containing protein n=1 Tax=Riccia fluitans TaxID=41844 RepID=A0ABD1ZLC0_9MARC